VTTVYQKSFAKRDSDSFASLPQLCAKVEDLSPKKSGLLDSWFLR
jgi:hypothetical protein